MAARQPLYFHQEQHIRENWNSRPCIFCDSIKHKSALCQSKAKRKGDWASGLTDGQLAVAIDFTDGLYMAAPGQDLIQQPDPASISEPDDSSEPTQRTSLTTSKQDEAAVHATAEDRGNPKDETGILPHHNLHDTIHLDPVSISKPDHPSEPTQQTSLTTSKQDEAAVHATSEDRRNPKDQTGFLPHHNLHNTIHLDLAPHKFSLDAEEAIKIVIAMANSHLLSHKVQLSLLSLTEAKLPGSNESDSFAGNSNVLDLQNSGESSSSLLKLKNEEHEKISSKKKTLNAKPGGLTADFALRESSAIRSPSKRVLTNYYKLEFAKDAIFYQYQIQNLPVNRSKIKTRGLIERIITKALDGSPALVQDVVYDNHGLLISWKELPLVGLKRGNDNSAYCELAIEDGRKRYGSAPTRNIQILCREKLDLEKLKKWTEGDKKSKLWSSSAEIKILNMLISHCLSTEDVIKVGANKFYVKTEEEQLDGPSLTTMPGFFYTVKPTKTGVLLNVNTVTSTFYKASRLVSEFLEDQSTIRSSQKRRDALRGVRVQITYARGEGDNQTADENDPSGRIYPIHSVGDHSIAQQTFPLHDINGKAQLDDNGQPKYMSVKSYMESKYNHTYSSKEEDMPAINLGTLSKPTWYAPTQLRIVEGQVFSRLLPDNLMETMHQRACKRPSFNLRRIEEKFFPFLKLRGPFEEDMVPLPDCPPLSINHEVLHIPATRLELPNICYNNNNKIDLQEHDRSSWNMAKRKFLSQGTDQLKGIDFLFLLAPDLVLSTGADKTSNTGIKYIEEIRRSAISYNIGNIQSDQHMTSSKEGLTNLSKPSIAAALTKYRAKSTSLRKVVVLVLKSKDIGTYQIFKDLADRSEGIHNICLLEEPNLRQKVENDNRIVFMNLNPSQYFGNVMMKLNLKFGGVSHGAVYDQDSRGALEQNLSTTLVLGADVTHPGLAAIQGCPSIAAIVGSVGKHAGRFLGSMRLQSQAKSDREIIQDVKDMVAERLQAWIDSNGNQLPENILYYRDGVSEGQYAKVKQIELSAIKSAFDDLAKRHRAPKGHHHRKKRNNKGKGSARDTSVKITAVVVAKRHNTRFYPSSPSDHDGKDNNCKPGTLVDDAITSPYFSDFFLQSHSALQGTAKPAHYFVLQDDMKMGAEALQNFTHLLNYTYVRSTAGVSYASPAYYADRLCDRGRAYLRDLLTGDPAIRRALNKQKSVWEKERHDLRTNVMFPRVRGTGTNKRRPPREEDDEILELVYRDEVAKLCAEWTTTKAQEIFNEHISVSDREQGRKNPWHPNLDDTMFWM